MAKQPAPKDNQAEGQPEAEAAPAPPQADVDLRNELAKIAFKEIVRWQLTNNRGAGQEGLAASWAFRYADKALAQSKVLPKSSVSINIRGVAGAVEQPIADQILEPLAEIP